MSRRMSASPEKPSVSHRMSSPTDQWQSRGMNPNNNYNNQAIRPAFQPMSHSYHIQRYGSGPFNTPTPPPPVTYTNPYASYETYPTPTYRPQPSFSPYSEANQPVYSTPDASLLSNINTNLDVEELKKVLLNANRDSSNALTEPSKSVSPESTVDPPEKMTLLLSQVKKITEEEELKKKTRKSIEKSLAKLEEELKEYENKIALRDRLRTVKTQLEAEEEALAQKRISLQNDIDLTYNNLEHRTDSSVRPVVARSEAPVKRPEHKSSPSKKTTVGSTHSTINNTPIPKTPTFPNKTTFNKPIVPPNKSTLPFKPPTAIPTKPLLKRPNAADPKPSTTKKVRISEDGLKTTPKLGEKHTMYRRTPIPLKSHPKLSVGVPKVAPTRRPPPTSTPIYSSGVRTSRPSKMVSSRLDRWNPNKDLQQSAGESSTRISETPKRADNLCETNSESNEMPASDDYSDNDIISELSKRIDFDMNSISVTTKKSVDTSVSNQSSSEANSLENVSNDRTERIDDNCDKNIEQSPEVSQTKSSETIATNETNEDIITIDSDDEEFVSEPIEVPIRTIKQEKVDVNEDIPPKEQNTTIESIVNQQLKDSNNRQGLDGMSSQKKTDLISDTPVQQSTSNDSNQSVFKTPTVPPLNSKKHMKYTGFESVKYEPTVTYTLGSFKAIAGPKSKTAQTSVITLKLFKDYLFASFMDYSVRRFHIEDKTDVFKYEGHENLVLSLIIIECPKNPNVYYLYTGGRDKKLRAFQINNEKMVNCIELKDEIICIDYNWSHIFCGLPNGTVSKVSVIHFTDDDLPDESAPKVQNFLVNFKKRICAIISVKPHNTSDSGVEPLITVSQNKLRVINTSDSVSDENRILHSIGVNYSFPIFLRTFRNYLFISFKMPTIKNEDKNKEDKSRVLVYDLQKDWTPIKTIELKGLVTAIDLSGEELIISAFDGKIHCIDCLKLELKWITYGSHITACAKIGDRLVLGNDEGSIDVIYLDQKLIDCETCGVPFARQKDIKQHIKLEHQIPDGEQE